MDHSFKVCAPTDAVSPTLSHSLSVLQALGIRYCEIRSVERTSALALGPERQKGIRQEVSDYGLSVAVLDNTSLAFELARDEDYSLADGGTGKSANTLTAQLAVEF